MLATVNSKSQLDAAWVGLAFSNGLWPPPAGQTPWVGYP